MSAIPPNVVGSVLQSGLAQRDAAKEIDTARTQDAEATRKSLAGPDAFVEVEATDADTQVHPDSGGLGGQGRYDAKPEQDEEPVTEEETDEVDPTTPPHIDLSA